MKKRKIKGIFVWLLSKEQVSKRGALFKCINCARERNDYLYQFRNENCVTIKKRFYDKMKNCSEHLPVDINFFYETKRF